MAKNLFIFNFRQFPRTFTIFLLLLLTTEAMILGFFSRYVYNPTNIKMREKIRAARDKEIEADILIIGDSSAGAAINACELEKRTGLKSFNFALMGEATLAGNYLILKEYLANKRPPKYIIMMNVYDIWHRAPDKGDIMVVFLSNYPKIVTLINWIELFPSLVKNKGRIVRSFISSFLPSIIYKYELKELLRNIPGFIKESSIKSEEIRKKIYKEKGTSIHEETDKEILYRNIAWHEKFIINHEFTISDWNEYFLRKFLNETERNNIKVYICYPPFYKGLYEKIAPSRHLLSYKVFMKGIADFYNHVSFLNDDFYYIDENKTLTVDHMNFPEAIAFTKLISKKILHPGG